MRDRLPDRRGGETFEAEFAGIPYVVTVGRYDDGRLGEVFLTSGKSGVAIQSWARDAAVLISLALQHGCSVATIRDALTREDDGSASGPVGALLDLVEAAA